jgi:hypothetical protein
MVPEVFLLSDGWIRRDQLFDYSVPALPATIVLVRAKVRRLREIS